MSTALLEALYTDLQLIIFSRKSNQRFICLNEPPRWFRAFAPDVQKGTGIDLPAYFPFLQDFLIDAQVHWQKQQQGIIESGLWIETDSDGKDRPLEALALEVQNQDILLLTLQDTNFLQRQNKQQLARKNLLTQEALQLEVERRARKIRAREQELGIRLLSASNYRDDETGTHMRRIGLYAAEIASTLGWSEERIVDFKMAAAMHDIGKISIPDEILLKPGRLDEAEFEQMKEHASVGGKLLAGSGIPMLDTAAQIANYHHEKWDGSGYPDGLKGEQIPEVARIVAIVDVYDAMTHERVYKKAYSEEKTLGIMEAMAGVHLDAELYGLFVSIIDRIRAIKDQNPDSHN
mgnify:CR=1 FL=1